MATLNEIAYNIKELMSGGDSNIENNISTRQIKHWIHYHRAKIIEEKILAGSPIDRRWIQPMVSRTLSTPKIDENGEFDSRDINEFNVIGNQHYHTNSPNSSGQTQGFSNSEYYGNDYHDENEFNYYGTTLNIPHTINVGQSDGITSAKLKKRIWNESADTVGRWSSWDNLPVKTKDEATFGWANKFANIKTPYIVPYNSLGDVGISGYDDNNKSYMFLEISGLRFLVSQIDANKKYEYWIDMHGILTNPTYSKKYIKTSSDIPEYEKFNDSTSFYPMSEEDLPLLISRVAEIEMSLIIKTPEDLVEDNVDTTKINIGGQQQKQ